jgi:peptidyl-prolyl cis-trans isomerase C
VVFCRRYFETFQTNRLPGGSIFAYLLPSSPIEKKMPSASARHILVDSEEKCNELKQLIADGKDFAELAAEHSSCPSGKQGGALGTFSPGQMVPEFDQAVFGGEVGVVQGPVKTQFGYHLLEVTERKE